MAGMFRGCSKLASLNLRNLNTSNVTNMNSMFYGCMGLNSLDLSNADFSKVRNSANMFLSVPNTMAVTVLDVAAETFIRSVLTGGTINIVG